MRASNGQRAKPPGGAPRTLPRQRSGRTGPNTLRRIGSSSTPAIGLAVAQGGCAAAVRSSSCSTPARLNPSPAAVADLVPIAPAIPGVSALSRSRSSAPEASRALERQSTGGSRAAVVPPAEEDDGAGGGKLSADGAVLPPWACPRASKIRYQPTTLVWNVHELPKGMALAAEKLDARRYQTSYADFGLDFRVRGAPPLARTSTLERISCDGGKIPPREGVRSPDTHKIKQPAWWGCGPKDTDAQKLSSSYEAFGVAAQEMGIGKEMTHSISVPRLDGRFEHQNPFMSQFAKRTDGGCIVYDTSVAGKSGCCARDPNCPKFRSRGF